MQEKAGQRGEQLTKRLNVGRMSLQRAVKDYFSAVQTEVDKTTQFLHDYLKDDIEAIRVHRLQNYGQNLVGVLMPTFDISANDLAPEYDLKTALRYHLAAFVSHNAKKLTFISGYDMLLSATVITRPKCIAACNLENKLEQLSAHGIEVVLKPPSKTRQKLVEGLIKKHNMIERFITTSSDNREINSSEF